MYVNIVVIHLKLTNVGCDNRIYKYNFPGNVSKDRNGIFICAVVIHTDNCRYANSATIPNSNINQENIFVNLTLLRIIFERQCLFESYYYYLHFC